MRNTKKAISILLTLLMVVGMMSTFAFAATGSSTIVVKNAAEGQEYNAYKIFDLLKSTDGNSYSYTITNDKYNEWGETIKSVLGADSLKAAADGSKYVLIQPNGGLTETQIRSLAAAMGSMDKTAITPEGTAFGIKGVDSKVTATINNLEEGYYFIDSSLGSLCILTAHDKQEIAEKNGKPGVEKTADKYTASLGDTINYTITITAGGNSKTDYKVTDNMASGLKYNGNTTLNITVDGVAVDSTKYSVTNPIGKAFEILFPQSYMATLEKGKQIVITYKATVIGETNIKNSVDLKFGETTSTDDTDTYTGKIEVLKYETGNKDKKLAGAKFVVSKDGKYLASSIDANGNKIYSWADSYIDNGNIIAGIETLITDNEGKASISGLAAGTYQLIEYEAPAGYNKLDAPVSVELKEQKTGDKVTGVVSSVKEIANSTGSMLPSTGGIGTTIFYLIGAILVIGAGVVFVTRRRMHSDK